MTHVCECPPGIFIIVNYIISAHCQPYRGFYNNKHDPKFILTESTNIHPSQSHSIVRYIQIMLFTFTVFLLHRFNFQFQQLYSQWQESKDSSIFGIPVLRTKQLQIIFCQVAIIKSSMKWNKEFHSSLILLSVKSNPRKYIIEIYKYEYEARL